MTSHPTNQLPTHSQTHTHKHTQSDIVLNCDFVYIVRGGPKSSEASAMFPEFCKNRWKPDLAAHVICLYCLGNTYKYQAGNRMNALLWFKHLSGACQSNRQQVCGHIAHTHTRIHCLVLSCVLQFSLFSQVPTNLMSFE